MDEVFGTYTVTGNLTSANGPAELNHKLKSPT
jgi:hypothetical protein